MKFYEIVQNVTERRTYLVDAPDEDVAMDRIDNGDVLPVAVKVTHQDDPYIREATREELVDA